MFVQINLNTATDAEILMIPGTATDAWVNSGVPAL